MDDKLLSYLLNISKEIPLDYFLHLNDESYRMFNVSIEKSPNPISKPTSRGGVYLSEKYSYRIKGTLNETSIIPKLSKTMLGPNSDFSELKITTSLPEQNKSISIYSNLTNSMHNSSKIELNMIIVRADLN